MAKYIALTFDDGPNTVTTPIVLDVLEKHSAVGTFFLVGNNINEESAKVVKRAVEMGCEIENHSRTHTAFPQLTAEEMTAEIDFTTEKIIGITGRAPKFFRPPYLSHSSAERAVPTGRTAFRRSSVLTPPWLRRSTVT